MPKGVQQQRGAMMIEPYILFALAKVSKKEDAPILGRLVSSLSGRAVKFANRSEELFAAAMAYQEKQNQGGKNDKTRFS